MNHTKRISFHHALLCLHQVVRRPTLLPHNNTTIRTQIPQPHSADLTVKRTICAIFSSAVMLSALCGITTQHAFAQSNLSWTGQTDSQWNTSTLNWHDGTGNTSFMTGDHVVFGNTGNNSSSITIDAAGVVAGNIIFNNNITTSYAFSGGGIHSTGSLTISGTGIADFTQTAGGNTFAGGVILEGGSLRVANAGQLGTTLSQISFNGNVSNVDTTGGGTYNLTILGGDIKTAVNNHTAAPDASNKMAQDNALATLNYAISTAMVNGTLATLRVADHTQLLLQAQPNSADQFLLINANKAAGIRLEDGASMTISNNTWDVTGAAVRGGALRNAGYVVLSAGEGARFVFNNNHAHSNSTAYGGAVYNTGTSILNNTDFIGNTISSSSTTVATYGGAVYNGSNSTSIFQNTNFSGNKAISAWASNGGAVYNGTNASALFQNVKFIDNSAVSSSTSPSSTVYGGAFYNSAKASFEDTNFIGNSAISSTGYAYGGAIYNTGINASLLLNINDGTTSTFSGNYVKVGAGATTANSVHMAGGNLTLNTLGNGMLDMRDPMSGTGAATINKMGTGFWRLGGDNTFAGNTSFNVGEGTLYLYRSGEVANANAEDAAALVGTGHINLSNAASSFTLGSAANNTSATLAIGGGNQINSAGSINWHTGNGANSKTTLAFDLGVATAETTPSSANAMLSLNAAGGLNIDTSGTGKLHIDLLSFNANNGFYTLVYNNGAGSLFDTTAAGNVDTLVTLRGQDVTSNNRLNSAAKLHTLAGGTVLQLEQNTANGLAVWTNADSSNNTWDLCSSNWSVDIAGTVHTQFVDHDDVLFPDLQAGGQTVTVSGNGFAIPVSSMRIETNTYDYTFEGDAITIADGHGTLVSNGQSAVIINNQINGHAQINDGVLIVGDTEGQANASISGSVHAENGTVVGGHGQMGSLVLSSGATVKPGNSIGTLTVGEITFSSGSIAQFEVDPNGTADKIIASTGVAGGTGNVTIHNGVTLDVIAGAGNWLPNNNYTLIEADGTITGQFDTINSNLAFITPAVTYTPNQINLTMARNNTSFAGLWGTYNQTQTGLGLHYMQAGTPLYNEIIGMNRWQALQSFDSLSGEIYASHKSALLTNARYSRNAIRQHLNGYNTPSSDVGKGLWVSTWGHGGNIKGDGNATKIDNKGFGIMLGADLLENDKATLGLAVGYEQTNSKAKGSINSKADTDAIHLLAYAKTQLNAVDIKGGIGYSRLSTDTKRHITVGKLASESKASYHGEMVQLFAEVSKTFRVNENINLTPYAELAYLHLKQKSFTEKGMVGALYSESETQNQTALSLGGRGQWQLSSKVNLYADLAWQHNFSGNKPQANLSFLGVATPYNVKGVSGNSNNLNIGLGGVFKLKPNMNLNIGIESQIGNRSKDYAGRLMFEMKF